MAVEAWKPYDLAIFKTCTGVLNLAATAYKIALFTPSGTWSDRTKSLYADITGELTTSHGYTVGGLDLAGETFTVGASSYIYGFHVTNPTWTASGGSIDNIGGAVIYQGDATAGNRHLLCYSVLSATGFGVESGNTLTLLMDAAGVFTVSGPV